MAHCADLSTPSVNDPPQLVEARQKVLQTIGQWVTVSFAPTQRLSGILLVITMHISFKTNDLFV